MGLFPSNGPAQKFSRVHTLHPALLTSASRDKEDRMDFADAPCSRPQRCNNGWLSKLSSVTHPFRWAFQLLLFHCWPRNCESAIEKSLEISPIPYPQTPNDPQKIAGCICAYSFSWHEHLRVQPFENHGDCDDGGILKLCGPYRISESQTLYLPKFLREVAPFCHVADTESWRWKTIDRKGCQSTWWLCVLLTTRACLSGQTSVEASCQ